MTIENTSKAVRFATNMRKIPRKVHRCEIYGAVKVIVDRKHATNIIQKMVPTATSVDIYDALIVLQERLNERA